MDIAQILGFYTLGGLFSLLFRGRALTVLGAIAAFIAIPFFIFLMIPMVLAALMWPIGWPALGFFCGAIAKSTFKSWAEIDNPFKYFGYAISLTFLIAPILLPLNGLIIQPDRGKKYAQEFIENTVTIPVQIGTEVLNIPAKRGGIEIGIRFKQPIKADIGRSHPDEIKRIEALIEQGPIESKYLRIKGLADNYNQKAEIAPRPLPERCNLPAFKVPPSCEFTWPDFNLTFVDPSLSEPKKTLKPLEIIRVIDEFDVVYEKWREPKTKGEKPILSDIKLRAALPQDFDSKDLPVFLDCNRIREYYLCRASGFYISDNQLVTYSFHAQEADIPKAFRESRAIASDYWTKLLETHGDKNTKTP